MYHSTLSLVYNVQGRIQDLSERGARLQKKDPNLETKNVPRVKIFFDLKDSKRG